MQASPGNSTTPRRAGFEGQAGFLGGAAPLTAALAQVVIAIVCLIFVLVATPAGGAQPSSNSAPSQEEISAVLAKHALAVMNRDRKAFAAGLDPASPASDYRTRQLQAFDNMADVPLASWMLTIDSAVTSADEVATASARVGASATIVKIDLAYALKDVDPAPTHHAQWLTFVHRNGRTVISSDSDLASAAGTSWQGPWEFGKVQTYRGRNSLVLAQPSFADQMQTVATTVDQAVTAVSEVWGSQWSQQVAVIVPNSQDEMSAVIGRDLVLDDITAVSVADSPYGSSPLGQRIVLNPTHLRELSDVGRAIVLRHEVTLIATRPSVGPTISTWLMEGFAEYVANLGSGQEPKVAAAELARDVAAGNLPTALPTATDFNSENTSLAQTYELSWLACRFLADRFGQDALLSVFHSAAKTANSDPTSDGDAAALAAIESVVGLTPTDFIAQWSEYVHTTLA